MDAPTIAHRRFTTQEFQQMDAAGIFGEEERLELLAGDVIEIAPPSPLHAASVTRLTKQLLEQIADWANIRVHGPICLERFSMPLPDIAVMRRRDDFYSGGHPEPEDVLLLIEVSESSLPYDCDVKLPLYATAGIAEVWLVAMLPQVVEVYRAPGENGYGEKRTMRRGDTLSPLHLPEAVLRVEEIIGERR